MPRHTYRLLTCNQFGVPTAELEKVTVTDVYEELNGWGSLSFRMATKDPKALRLHVCHKEPSFWSEVQLWRDSTLIFWGIPVRAEATGPETIVQCFGLLWYFARDFIGPNTSQFLGNPEFESNLTGWTPVGAFTPSAVTTNRILGTKSAKFVSATAGLDEYLVRSFTFVHGGAPGSTITFDVAAWFYIESAGWLGPAFAQRGLHVHSHSGATILDERWEPINNDSPRDEWFKLITHVVVPTGATTDVDVRLYAPGGTIYADAVAVKVASFVGASPAIDLGSVLANILNYSIAGYTADGFNPNMAVSTATVGLVEARVFPTDEHANVWQAASEWPARDIADIGVVWNAGGTTRTVTSWSPRRGTHRPNRAVQIDDQTGNQLRKWSLVADITQSAGDVRVFGQGSGPTREFGQAKDASTLGGCPLRSSIAAPSEVPIGAFAQIAAAELARGKRPVRLPSFTVPSDPWLNEVQLGDTIPFTANYGWVSDLVGSTLRVVGRRLNPIAESLELTVNLP